jgi:hypothetical protein
MQDDWVNGLPRWGGTRWLYPASHLLVTDLRPYFEGHLSSSADFAQVYHGFEYRLGLIQERTQGYHALSGEYVGDRAWDGDVPTTESALRRQLERGRATAWLDYYGGPEELEAALIAQREVLKRYRRWG